MKRSRIVAALAAACIVAAGASSPRAAPPSTEPGVPPGQVSVQLFDYVAYLFTGQRDEHHPTPVPVTTLRPRGAHPVCVVAQIDILQDPPLDFFFGGPTPPNDPFVDGAISFPNLKGAPAPVLHALPPAFEAGQRGGTTGTPQTVTVRNRGDAPLTISTVAVQADAPDAPAASDFAITGQTCSAAPVAPGATCAVSVAFKPALALTTSLARLRFTSDADDATDSVMLVVPQRQRPRRRSAGRR